MQPKNIIGLNETVAQILVFTISFIPLLANETADKDYKWKMVIPIGMTVRNDIISSEVYLVVQT